MVDHEDILRYGEIVKLAEIFASLGIEKIKLTGGEPLVRKESMAADKKAQRDPRYTSGDIDNKWGSF